MLVGGPSTADPLPFRKEGDTISMDESEKISCALRPASTEEAGLFYAMDPEKGAELGDIGHLRMDFGSDGKQFYTTWFDHGSGELNTREFKTEIDRVVNTLREGVLKDRASMRRFCAENGGVLSENYGIRQYGYIYESEHYRYCLRCKPQEGDYDGYLWCYDKRVQEMRRKHDAIAGEKDTDSVEIQEITTEALCQISDREGIVFEGCAELPGWVKGINDTLTEAGILLNGTRLEKVSTFKRDGLTCLFFDFEGAELNMGKLAIWRLQTHGQLGGTWLSDYVPNRLGGFLETPEVECSGQEEEMNECTDQGGEGMNGMMRRERVQRIREQYPPGTRIRLNYMEDAHAVPAGTEGTVFAVDDIGNIFMNWDNGRSLALIPGVDSFSVIQQKQEMTMQMGGM